MSLLMRLDRLPVSRPHYRLLLAGGLGYAFDAMDIALIAFLLPPLQAFWSLSGPELGLIGSATPVGVLIGALLAGYIGDRFGRKVVMCWALAVYCAMTLAAAAAPNYPTFVAARLLAGVGTGAESAIIAPFLSEFIPPAKRGRFIGSLAGFFSFGFVGAALLGRYVVPEFDDGWRYAQVITALPVVMLLWWRRVLPESPRFLLSRGRQDEARRIVEQFEREVETATGRPLPVPTAKRAESAATAPSPGLCQSLAMMFSRPMRRQTLVIWITWFALTFSFYGFFSWIPSLLVARGFTVTQSFAFSLIIFSAQVPGFFSAAFISDWLDRKWTIALYLVGSIFSAWGLSQAQSAEGIVTAAALLSMFLNGCYAGLYTYTPESFPTAIRATGCGFASAFGRIGSILAPSIIGIFSSAMGFTGVFTMIAVMLAGGILVLLAWGVNTRGGSLEALEQRIENSPPGDSTARKI